MMRLRAASFVPAELSAGLLPELHDAVRALRTALRGGRSIAAASLAAFSTTATARPAALIGGPTPRLRNLGIRRATSALV